MKIVQISIYPGNGEKHSNMGGVASYTKNLMTNLYRHEGDKIFVLCDKINGKYESYFEDGMSIVRCFGKGPIFLPQLYREIKKIQPDAIHVQQELGLFGNVLTAYLLQWLFLLLGQYKLIVTLHGVVSLKGIDNAFVRENNSRLPVWLVKVAFYIIYKPLCILSKRIIVHEEIFKAVLKNEYGVPGEKIVVIPHGVEDLHTIEKTEACNRLSLDSNKNLVLFMGYLTGYKGIDLLLEGFSAYAKSNPDAYLVIGSGKHPKLKDDPDYNLEYARLKEKAADLIGEDQYRWDGFIEENDITNYYSACDISVYPYTVSMSSSGPMAIAIGFEKPFLASDVFDDVINFDQLLFKRNSDSLARQLERFFSNRQEFSDEISKMKLIKLWSNVGIRTRAVYNDVL